jgi:transposase InsO family protein
MFHVIIVGPFTKWGIDYTTCNPPSAREHRYIIVAVDYFTKWVEAMPTFKDDGETATLFLFNQIIARFDVPREIVTDHGSHFQNQMMTKLTSKLGLRQEHSSPYYPQANGQVEAINKTLKTILQRTINSAKSN